MSNLNYIPLHGHSAYSIGDGVAKIEDIVKRAIEINSPAIALTEHGNMCSFLKFYKECKKNNIKPIMGCELYVNESFYANRDKFLELQKSKKTKKQKNGEKIEEDTVEVVETESTDETDKKVEEDSVDLDESTVDDDSALGDINDKNSHVVVYAKNLQGLKNIIQLSNIASNNFYKKPLVSHELILTHLDSNNIVTTACMASDWNKFTLNKQYNESVALYKRYKERFGDDFYAEIHLNEIPEQKTLNLDIIKICNKLSINTLFSLDYHYVYKDDWYIQYLLYVVKSKHTVETMTPDDWFYNTRTLYIKTYDEVIEEFKKYEPEYFESLKMSLNNTLELNEKIENFEIPFYQNNYPKFLENYEDSCKLFKEKIIEGFKKKLLNGLIPEEKQQIYLERVRKEFDIIKSKGHVDYFLIYEDVVNNFVKNSGGNLGCGRGSAAGSLILFLLDVTKVDSIRFNLLFERFLNPQRKDPPDIDTDCDSETRKNIEIYLKQKYGEDKVCHISNFTTFGPKTIVKDLARIFKLDYMKSNKLTGTFSATGEKSISEELDNARQIFDKLGKKDMVKFVDDNYEIFTKYGTKFVDNPRQVGKHASGILISNKELIKSDIPTMCLKGEIVTALQEGVEVKEVGELGYVKLDILGLTTVSIIKDAIKQIENTKNVKNIENMIIKSKMDDKKVYEQFKLGETKDIFQFGSEQMIALMKNISPDSIEDLSAGNALFRPACIESGMIQEYLDNKKDAEFAKSKYDQISPLIWETLSNTYGTILYQEQIMFILQNVGGFTLAEADSARKIMKVAKSGESDKKFADLLEKFKHSAVKNGLREADAIDLIDKMVNYLKYSFNFSHSVSYSINGYLSMWLKVYFPYEYCSTFLNYADKNEMGYFIKEFMQKGIKFDEMKLGKVSSNFKIRIDENDNKNKSIMLGLNIIKGIQSKDIEKIINEGSGITELNSLINFVIENNIGKKTLDPLCRLGFFSEIYPNSNQLEKIIMAVKGKKNLTESKIQDAITKFSDVADHLSSERTSFEKQYVGFYLSSHPFDKYWKELKELKGQTFLDSLMVPKRFDSSCEEGQYNIAGIVSQIKPKKTKKTSKDYYNISLEDDIKTLSINIWNAEDFKDVKVGDFIYMKCYKNSFGISKANDSDVKKFFL